MTWREEKHLLAGPVKERYRYEKASFATQGIFGSASASVSGAQRSSPVERLLRTQRKPAPCGLSTTRAGTLLKHQIPIRTFAGWEDAQPGFLEADLVAHCGGHTQGSYLYTLPLTDVATGWTECLPLLARTSDPVLAAFVCPFTHLPHSLMEPSCLYRTLMPKGST